MAVFKEKFKKIINICFGTPLNRVIAILLLLVIIASVTISITYAKYVKSSPDADGANVAGVGVNKLEVKEHKPINDLDYMIKNNVLHKLDMSTEIGGNYSQYNDVPPGVDIPKDSFVNLDIESEVTYELYLLVTKTSNFPSTVTFSITSDWEEVPNGNGLYKYKGTFASGTHHVKKIEILEGNKLTVSDKYSAVSFGIEFEVYLKQVLEK